MGFIRNLLMPALLASICFNAAAGTYKCVKGGQTIYSDLPCTAGANRVDDQADKVSKDQRRQAEDIRSDNRKQLSELEYQATRDRYAPRKAVSLSR